MEELSQEFGDLDTVTGFEISEIERLLGYVAAEPGKNTAPAMGGLKFSVIVECDSEQHQTEVLEQLEASGYTCRLTIT